MAKHAKPAPARSGAGFFLAILIIVVAVAAAVAVALIHSQWAAWAAAAAGLVIALVIGVAVLRLSRQVRRLRVEAGAKADRYQRELAALRLELVRSRRESTAILEQLTALRSELAGYVLPVAAEEDVVYPSLHLPLVREAFADSSPDATVLAYRPPTVPPEVPPTVESDGASEGLQPTFVDLTGAHRARHAAGA